jgi:gamma-glutamylcysteine synthetase
VSGQAAERIYRHVLDGFERAVQDGGRRRVGAELKFPFVKDSGEAVERETVDALWAHLVRRGWRRDTDTAGGPVVGARRAGECNDTVASCETGYCKVEFSLAHAADIHGLRRELDTLEADVRPFLDAHGVRLLGYGIQPVTAPSADLLMRKMRASFWDKALPSNRVLPPEKGDDVHLFTVNACSHVHVSTTPREAVRLVNVLNGLAGAQLSVTAHSNVVTGWDPPPYKCINEKLWDWWEPVRGRVGVPEAPFADLRDYVTRVSALRPIYVKRAGRPVLLSGHYERFSDYFAESEALGATPEGERCVLRPSLEDIAVHHSCYWYTARISRYFTVENRVFDQQAPDALLAPAALTLGLACAAEEAWEEVSSHAWATLRETREQACRAGMDWRLNGTGAASLAGRMLEAAELGLRRRGRGEESFLAPLQRRWREGTCPADDVAALGRDDWPRGLLALRSW